MSTRAELQNQILTELADYSDALISGTKVLIGELRNSRQSDTDELFNLVIQGINWEIEVFNNCEDLINSKEMLVDKSKMVKAVTRLGKILQEKDDIKMAACLEVDFLPFLENMELAGKANID